MKFDRIILQVNTHRLTESIFFKNMTPYFQDGSHNARPPLAAANAAASAGFPLARWRSVCATVPDPKYIWICFKKEKE